MINGSPESAKTEANGVPARVIVGALRHKIVTGDWVSGDRVPTRNEIEAEFGASRVTVQRALDELRRDGWVAVNGRQGTYVASDLPHLTRYALVFSHTKRPHVAENSFWSSLSSAASNINEAGAVSISVYLGVDGHEDSEDYQRLVREVRAHRVAGLIFASNPSVLRGTPLLDEPNVPRIAIMSGSKNALVPYANLNSGSFWNRALDHVQKSGRTKVAFLMPSLPEVPAQITPEALAKRGFSTRPFWNLVCSQSIPQAAHNTLHLLMHPGQDERPDALIISDDNLVEQAVLGVLASGTEVPRDIEIVGHCNFPRVTPSPVPITRLGFDSRELLEACLEGLREQREGIVPPIRSIPAIFDREVSGDS